MNLSVERSALRAMRRQVNSEMDDFARAKGFDRWAYFNNFYTNIDGSYVRRNVALLGIGDITHREFFLGVNQKDLGGIDLKDYSQLFLSQTPNQFFGAIDDLIKRKRISKGRLHALYEVWAVKDLHRLLFPVFVHLRALGYNRHELTY